MSRELLCQAGPLSEWVQNVRVPKCCIWVPGAVKVLSYYSGGILGKVVKFLK